MAYRNAVQLNIAEYLENTMPGINRRRFHLREDPFQLPERHFIKLFRLNKERTRTVIDLVKEHSIDPSRSSALNATVEVLTALNFFAYGSYQLSIGKNIYMAVSQSSVSRSIHKIIDILNLPEVFNNWVKFPRNLRELTELRNRFWIKHHFPGVVGCIDCTHVAIFPPPREDEHFPEHIYVNRKGYHSINVQLICDPDLQILHVNSRFPGSTHDSYIWNNSNVLPLMRDINNRGHKFFLLGDSGYSLRPWMMTPVLNNNLSVSEIRYNGRHGSTRSLIERCNGLLKMRFRCLLKHRVLHYRPDVCSKIINACVVLHNMCIHDNLPDPQLGDEEEFDFGMNAQNEEHNAYELHINRVNPELTAGRRIRDSIIRKYF